MARPPARQLTERELEVMHVFWNLGEGTAANARDRLAARGIELAYVTVANLIRILVEKRFLEQATDDRPFLFRAIRSFSDVSHSLVGELVDRVFGGSREKLLVNLLGQSKLTSQERARLQAILREDLP